MNIYKYSKVRKNFILGFLYVLMASSLFAFVLPIKNGFLKADEEKEITPFSQSTHPLNGSSDNIVVCPNDGSELHEIYLCGAFAERLLTTNITDLKQIVWSKLQPGSCSNGQTNCANNSPNCIWNELSTDTQLNITEDGEYRIFVQYNDNTSERYYFNVFKNSLEPSELVTNIDCGTDGSISINNVPSNYEFSIDSGITWQDSNQFAITSVNHYDVQFRRKNDPNGCLFTIDNIFVDNNAIDANATIAPITCNNSKGGIEINIADASSTYIYELSQGGNLINSSGPITSSNYVFSDLSAGTYDINVTLASVSACSWNATQTIPGFVNVQPEVVVTKNIDCTDGIITVTQNGGSAPYEYSLDNGATYTPFTAGNQTTINISTAGTYNIKVKDIDDCEVDAPSVDVIDEPEINFNVIPKDISCDGANDGSILVDVTNTQGYSITYSIDGGANFQTSNVFSNLSVGTYSILIRKQKAGGACEITAASVAINSIPAIVASASVSQQIDCSNGSATIGVTVDTGGTAPFEYSIDGTNFQTSASITGLGAGDYTITVKDSNGCLAMVDQIVNAGSNPSDLTFLTSNLDCSTGATDVQVVVQNGQSPFTYEIIAPSAITSSNDTFVGLLPNTYTFEVTTNDGCKIIRNFIVSDPQSFSTKALVKTNVSCANGTPDGSIELFVNDFNTAFNVIVEDGTGTPLGLGITNQTSSPIIIPNLAADNYTLRISDTSSTCDKIETVSVSNPPSPLTIDSFSVSNINCGSPGMVTIEASGGWGNYSYAVQQPDLSITPSQGNKTITGLNQEGIHTIRVIDSNGCLVDTTTFDLIDQGGPTAAVDVTNSNYCYSSTTKGELKIDVSTGIAPYFYTVNNGTPLPISSGTFTLSNLTPDDYIIKVIGGNGCETIVADTEISGQLFAIAQVSKPLGCGPNPDAIIDIIAEEGYPNPNYEYEVSKDGGSYIKTSNPYSASTEGTYSFKVIDSKGCQTITNSVIVTPSPHLSSSSNVTETACGKAGTGSVELIAIGGTPPFTYSFNGSPFTNQSLYTGLDAQNYNFSIRDALGCELIDEVVLVSAEPAITADVTKTDISCNPINPPGGNIWGNTNITNVQNATGLVTIKLIRVSSPAAHAAGTARYWTYREYNNVDMSAHPSGYNISMRWPHHFYVEIEDEKGCIFESELFEIFQPPLPWVQKAESSLDQSCANGASFEISVGGDPGDPSTLPGDELIGPFEYRIWPYDENNPPSWRSFENAGDNLAFGEDVDTNGIERDFRVSGLLFGVNYAIILKDTNTGCQRWRGLGRVDAPAPPDNNIDVISTPQSLSCYSGSDGKVKFTISGAGDADLDGDQTVDWSIRHTSDIGPGHDSHPWIPSYRRSGTFVGPATGDFEIDVTGLKLAWYVVEITAESGCKSGNRFLIYRPKSRLKLELDEYVTANCNIGAQVAVNAIGGWDNQAYFNVRNKLDQATWHEYEYAYVVDGTDPATLPASAWTNNSFNEITPSAYDGVNNVYQVYVRDGGGCIVGLNTPITITQDAEPVIDKIDVTNRCTSTDEIYDVVASLSQNGTGSMDYIWNGEVTNSPNKQLGPGTHELTVRDENGCSNTQNIFIYPQLVPQIEISKTVDCDPINAENGELLASAYGGSGTYEFTISPIPSSYAAGEETNTTGIFNRVAAGVDYIVTVTDVDPQILPSERCLPQDTPVIQLDIPATPDFVIDAVYNVSCNGANDGKIIVAQNTSSDNLDVTYEYSIDGINFQSSNMFENLAPGAYSISVRSSKNCIQLLPPTNITEPSVLQLATPLISPFECTSDNSIAMASITADVGNTGVAPYVYSFDNGTYVNSNTFELPFLTTSRTITIAVIDANNCTDQITATIPAATKVNASIVENQPMNCEDDAIISVVGANGSGAFNYETRELPSGNLINGTGKGDITIPAGNPGTYVYELTDIVTGCTDKVIYTIPDFDTIEVSINKLNDIYCFGGSDGGIEFEVSGYNGNYDYNIFELNTPTIPVSSGSENTSNGIIPINTLSVGTYFVSIEATDNPNCEVESERITIQSPVKAMDFTWTVTQDLTCQPGNDAQITATPIGGWGGFEFALIDPANVGTPIQAFSSNNIFNGLTAGINYELTLRDVRGCNNVMKVVNIPPIDFISLSTPTVTQPNCPGSNDGTIAVIASRTNGPANYQYILNNITTGVSVLPSSSGSFTNLAQGNYSITAIDGYGCDATTSTISIIDPATVEITGTITQEPGCTPNSGEISVSATGGSGSFEYSIVAPLAQATGWSAQTIYSSLPSGTYEFLARDADPTKHCISPVSVVRTINTVEPIQITVDDSNAIINCNGDADAVLVAQGTGGLGGYQYQLEVNGLLVGTPQNSGIFENLGPASYRIRVISGSDCEAYNDSEIIINEPALLSANFKNLSHVQCFGEDNGSFTIEAEGGVEPYQYILSSNPQKAVNSNSFENLAGGTYSVIVQDASGCESIADNIVINAPAADFEVTVVRIEDEVCSKDNNGLIELQFSGGTPPYAYNLSETTDPFTSFAGNNLIIDNLDGGFYTINVKDANGCNDVLLEEVKTGADLSSELVKISECLDGQPHYGAYLEFENDDLDKTELLFVLDDTNPNNPDINNAQLTSEFSNITPGKHTISILHTGTGCLEVKTFEIEAQDALSLSELNGSINQILVQASGGSGSYMYYMDEKMNSEGSFYITESGNYNVKVIDAKGCEASIDIPLEFIDIEIPKFFTPDGDGKNDVWRIGNSEGYTDMYVRIYDRYGRTIKEWISDGEWDGSYNKTTMPTGDYWYVIKLNGPNDEREFVGHFTVYR